MIEFEQKFNKLTVTSGYEIIRAGVISPPSTDGLTVFTVNVLPSPKSEESVSPRFLATQ